MPTDDSLAEYERAFWEQFAGREDAVRAFVAAHRRESAAGPEDPRTVVNRAVLAVFRGGVSRYVRKALWRFLEEERRRRNLTQERLAESAGISQSAYAKIGRGETSFEGILLVLRALGIEIRSVPGPPVGEQTAEGLMAALDFVQREVLGRREGTFKPRREDVEWLLFLEACTPWTEALAGRDEGKGNVVAQCVATAITIRLGRHVRAPSFELLAAFWERWVTAWEVCMGAVTVEVHAP